MGFLLRSVRAHTTQYRETDWAFVQRLMAQEGWSWRLDHDANQHTLVIFDELAAVPDVGALRFGRTDLRSASGHGEDKITAWSVGQQVGPNAVTPRVRHLLTIFARQPLPLTI